MKEQEKPNPDPPLSSNPGIDPEVLSRIKLKILYADRLVPAEVPDLLIKLLNDSFDLEKLERKLDQNVLQADELCNLDERSLIRIEHRKNVIEEQLGSFTHKELLKILADIPQLREVMKEEIGDNNWLRYELLKRIVINQDEALKQLCICCYQFEFYLKDSQNNKEAIKPSSYPLLLGGSGTGKTFMVEQVAKMYNLPVVRIDASRLTMEGYVGLQLGTQLLKAIRLAKAPVSSREGAGELYEAVEMIVFIDEFDKLSSLYNYGDNSDYKGAGILNELLPFLDNRAEKIEIQRVDNSKSIDTIDVSKTMFVFGGAFDRFRKKVKASVGFAAEDRHYTPQLSELQELYPTEISGRLGQLLHLKDMDEEVLKRILKNPSFEPMRYYKQFFKKHGEALVFSEEETNYIVREALRKGTGARALKVVLDKHLVSRLEKILNI